MPSSVKYPKSIFDSPSRSRQPFFLFVYIVGLGKVVATKFLKGKSRHPAKSTGYFHPYHQLALVREDLTSFTQKLCLIDMTLKRHYH